MKVVEIQSALQEEGLDGWLFFDHHLRDPLAYRVLGLETKRTPSRRWYYFIPATGDPRALVHRIESGMLEALPGKSIQYSGWSTQVEGLRSILGGACRVAMQYSSQCAIPVLSMVDAGTVELVRSVGVEVISSANLIQLFEARWSGDQLEMHLEAGRRVDRVRAAAFDRIAESLKSGALVTEWDINRFIRGAFEREGLVTDHGPIVAVNANMSDPHYEPQPESAVIRPGDSVLIDMWAKLNKPGAVYYDITWTGHCGTEVPSNFANVFQAVTGGRDSAIEKVQSSIAAGIQLCGFEVDDAARSFITQAGYGEYFIHRTGHSIGEEVHGNGANMDNLETHDERRVIADTCFSIEPGVYLPEFGIRSEVNMFIGKSQAIVTGEIQRLPLTIV